MTNTNDVETTRRAALDEALQNIANIIDDGGRKQNYYADELRGMGHRIKLGSSPSDPGSGKYLSDAGCLISAALDRVIWGAWKSERKENVDQAIYFRKHESGESPRMRLWQSGYMSDQFEIISHEQFMMLKRLGIKLIDKELED